MKFRFVWLLLLVFAMAGTGYTAIQTTHKGPREIEIFGGRRGNIQFPHRRHQQQLKDCKICHTLFEQKAGSIRELQKQGKLKKKEVMTYLCLKCHRAQKKLGEKGGPTSCKKCHTRK